jgi:hypothetical protein
MADSRDVPSPDRASSPAFQYLPMPTPSTTIPPTATATATAAATTPSPMAGARCQSPTETMIAAAATAGELLSSATSWAQSPLWDKTYDEARFHNLVERHRHDAEWLYFELKVTRRRMHESWGDNQELATRAETHAQTQRELDAAQHKIIDLKRERTAAMHCKGEDDALLQRLRGRCESLLVANERLEEFYQAAQTTESKWVTGLAECETYMKQLVEQLEDASRSRDHYKKWAVDRTEQLREAEDTLTKLLAELRGTALQRDTYQQASEEYQKKLARLTEELAEQQKSTQAEAADHKKQQAYAQEEIVALKIKLANSESTRMEAQSRAEELERSYAKIARALNANKECLAASDQKVRGLQEAKLSVDEELRVNAEKVAVLESQHVANGKEMDRLRMKSTERKGKIQVMGKEVSELRLALEQSQWSVQVARLEREREVADSERQREALQIEHSMLRKKYTALQHAIEVAQAGAEAAAVARTVAKHEMANEEATHVAAIRRSKREARRRRKEEEERQRRMNAAAVEAEAVEAELQARVRREQQQLQKPAPGKRRGVLGTGLIQSLEKNVVDYALLSLQRTALKDKSEYIGKLG